MEEYHDHGNAKDTRPQKAAPQAGNLHRRSWADYYQVRNSDTDRDRPVPRAAAGLRERGYEAVGGEAFALLLPVMYYLISTTVKDWIDDIRAEARKGGRR